MKLEQNPFSKKRNESISLLRDVPKLSDALNSLFLALPSKEELLNNLDRQIASDAAEAERTARIKIPSHSPAYDEEERVLRSEALADIVIQRALLACLRSMRETINSFPPREG